MNVLRVVFISLAISVSCIASAQQALRFGSISTNVGMSTYYGELNNKLLPSTTETIQLVNSQRFTSWSIDYEQYFGNSLAVGISYTNAVVSASDRALDWNGDLVLDAENFDRSLHFRTEIEQYSLYSKWSGNDGRFFKTTAFFSPYVKFGMGFSKFTSYGDLFDANGWRYLYGRDELYGVEGGDILAKTQMDGVYETELRPLNTEAQPYGKFSITTTAGLGLNFRFCNAFSIQLGTDVQFMLSDNLDNVSGPFFFTSDEAVGAANNPAYNSEEDTRGEPGNDWYAYTYVGARIYFGKRSTNSSPRPEKPEVQ
ncbi:MAG: hypothetical protein AB8F78_10730 [Saprospiraceae bacterium]